MTDRRYFERISIFNIFKKLVEDDLNKLEDYINEASSQLKEKQEKLNIEYANAISNEQENTDFDVEDYLGNDIYKYFNVFPIYTFNPLLLILYGQLENWLKKLCDLDSRKGFTSIKVSDLAGNNYIEKSRRYLNLVSEIQLLQTDEDWKKITEIQKVRNCIAHNNSNIVKNDSKPLEQQELFSILAKDNRIELDKSTGNFYIRDKNYLLEVITLIKSYLFSIIESLSQKRVIARNVIMPYDNTNWGKEKSEKILETVIHMLKLMDDNERRDDDFKYSDLDFNLRSNLRSMCYNITKIYAFFCSGDWDVKDADLIVKEGKNGLEKLKEIYNS